MSSVKKLCLCALCIALCCVLPTAFHGLGLGTALSPMHLPVLLCGLVCGPWLGAVCGLAGPVLSSITTGMPGTPMLMTMVPELVVYGLCAGLFLKLIRTGRFAEEHQIGTRIAVAEHCVCPCCAELACTAGAYRVIEFVPGHCLGVLPRWSRYGRFLRHT